MIAKKTVFLALLVFAAMGAFGEDASDTWEGVEDEQEIVSEVPFDPVEEMRKLWEGNNIGVFLFEKFI